MLSFEAFRTGMLQFVESCRMPDHGPGRYRFAAASPAPTLYSSCYAAMTRDLLNDLQTLPSNERRAWAEYIHAHQDADGLFRDPAIFGEGWYAEDPFWCGRPHLTCHVIIALACLGERTRRSFALAEHYSRLGTLEQWLASRDFGARVAWTGNEIMNLGVLLQYARDFHGDDRAGRAVDFILEWLSQNHLSAATGVWGSLDVSDPLNRSHAVQAAYHWWPLYFYDRQPVPHLQRALDTVLATQNPTGSFGWGVHNPQSPFDASACEDIDSIDPLVRMAALAPDRRPEVVAAMQRALPRLLTNRTPDGGMAFIRGRELQYGHPLLYAPKGRGGMFPSWFRTLVVALAAQVLCDSEYGRFQWRFTDCPGYQFARFGEFPGHEGKGNQCRREKI